MKVFLKSIKDKIYYYFAEKNWGVRREYGPYVDAHRKEHRTQQWKHWWLLIRLNWHYRILRSKEYLLSNAVKPTVKPTVKSAVKSVKLPPDDTAYRLPNLLTNSEVPKRYTVVFLAYRPQNSKGGPGGVCAAIQSVFGAHYNGIRLKYYFAPASVVYPKHLMRVIKGYEWFVRIQFQAAYFVQRKIDVWATCDKGNDVFFVCHDVGSAYGVYLCGKKYVLIYHQQGSLVNEAHGAGVELTEEEIFLLNNLEETVMTHAQTVYFPSLGAQKEYLSTSAIDYCNVHFGPPLYNTILEKSISFNAEKVAADFGLSSLNRDEYEIFLTIGDYNENKGIDRVPILLNEYVKVTKKKIIWIAIGDKLGSGIFQRLQKEQKSWLFESFIIGERIEHDKILALMEQCDFYIMLHRKSIFDLATLEAMRAGLVPVLTNVGGNSELCRDDNIIFVDIDHIGDAIEELQCIDLLEMRKKNQRVFQTYFSTSVFYHSYGNMIQEEMEKLGILPRVKSEVNKKNLLQFKNKYLGETVIICGGGSSLHDYQPIPGVKHIALNRTIFCDKIKFDALFMQDYPAFDTEHTMEDYNEYPCDKFYGIITHPRLRKIGLQDDQISSCSGNVYRYELAPRHFDKTIDQYEFDLSSYCVSDANSVLFSALQFAVYAGFKKIYLVGVDFSTLNYDLKENKSSYARIVISNLLAFKYQLRLYDESVDLNVINSTNPQICSGLGIYKDIITVTGFCSGTDLKMYELQKRSCRDNYRFDYQYFTDKEWAELGVGSDADSLGGYFIESSVRVQLLIDRVKRYWGQLLLLTAADLVFFKKTEEMIRRQLRDNDILFLKEEVDNYSHEGASLNINLGFVLMRCNDNTLKFWEEIKYRVEQKNGWDQKEVNLLLMEKKDLIRWGYFSDDFSKGGEVEDKNIVNQYICAGCGTVAERDCLDMEKYFMQLLEKTKMP